MQWFVSEVAAGIVCFRVCGVGGGGKRFVHCDASLQTILVTIIFI